MLHLTDTVYLRDGRVQTDNNLVENTIRPSAIGKKNWLFMGDAKSGQRAATINILIGNCHRQEMKKPQIQSKAKGKPTTVPA